MNKKTRSSSRKVKTMVALLTIAIIAILTTDLFARVCMYVVDGSWTGRLVGCYTESYTYSGSLKYKGVGGGGSYTRTETICVYKAYDPYGIGISGTQRYSKALVDQC